MGEELRYEALPNARDIPLVRSAAAAAAAAGAGAICVPFAFSHKRGPASLFPPFRASALPPAAQSGFTEEMFLEMCVLAGCDYLPSLHNVGIKKAHALVRRFRTHQRVLKHLRFEGTSVSRDYERSFACALLTFHHHWVYDPHTQALAHRRPPPPEQDLEALYALIGRPHAPELARGVAEARLCPVTLRAFEARPPPRRSLARAQSVISLGAALSIPCTFTSEMR